MFEGGSIVRPFPVGTVIRWEDDGRRDCGRITAVRTQAYAVKNGKGELRAVNTNDHSIRVVRKAEGPERSEIDGKRMYQYLYMLWKAI